MLTYVWLYVPSMPKKTINIMLQKTNKSFNSAPEGTGSMQGRWHRTAAAAAEALQEADFKI